MLPKKLVYRDLETNQLVTDSYKVYQAFNMREHRQVIILVESILKSYSDTTLNMSNNFIPTILKSDKGVSMDGFKITNKGFQKLMFAMGVPRKQDTKRIVFEIQDKFIEAFNIMEDLISNHLVKIPTNLDMLELLQRDLNNGRVRYRRGSFIVSPEHWKTLKEDSVMLDRYKKLFEILSDNPFNQ